MKGDEKTIERLDEALLLEPGAVNRSFHEAPVIGAG